MILKCLGPSVPHYHLVSMNTTKHLALLDSQPSLSNLSSSLAWPMVQYLTIPLPSGDQLQARVLLPPELDAKEVKKYPLLLNM